MLVVRVIGTLLLLGTTVLLAVWFGSLSATPDPASMHFPGGAELASNPSALVGSHIEIYGRVVATDPITIRGTYGGRDLQVAVHDVTTEPAVGEYLHVYGVVQADHSIRALDTVVYPATGITVTYAVSAVAAAWTLGRFMNRWRFDTTRFAFVPRDAPLVDLLAASTDPTDSGGGHA